MRLFPTLLACLLAALAWPAHAERVMARSDRVLLYDQGRVRGSLKQGTVVDAQPYARDRRYLVIRWDGADYVAAADQFLTRRQVQEQMDTDTIDARTDLEAADRDLRGAYEQLMHVHAAIIHVDRDRALLYRTYVDSIRIDSHGDRVVVREERHASVVSSARARRLIDDWEEEIDELQDTIRALWKDRVQAQSRLYSAAERYRGILARFDGETGADSLWADYIITAAAAQIYRDKKLVGELPRQRVVRARPSPDYQGWLILEQPDGPASLSADAARPLHDWKLAILDAYSKSLVSETRIREELQVQENRRDLMRDFSRQLAYYSRLGRSIVLITDDGLSPGFGTVYVVNQPVSATLAIQINRARDVVDDWDEDLAATDKRIDELRRALADARKDSAALSRDMQALDVAIPATRGAADERDPERWRDSDGWRERERDHDRR